MPVMLENPDGEVVATKKVAPPAWDIEQEYVEILVYLKQSDYDRAVAAGKKITVIYNKPPKEEYDRRGYFNCLAASQIKGWKLLDPEGNDIPYTPENLARIPWDLLSFLNDEILACGGIIPTQNVVLKAADGKQELDFRS